MKWKALALSLVALAMVTLAVSGCGQSSTAQTATPTAANAAPATTPRPGGAPPSMLPGDVSGNMTLPSIDLSAVAKALGVTEEQLRNALGGASQGPMDLPAAAKQLGVSEVSLRQALGFQQGAQPQNNNQPAPPTRPQ
jgi:hypothetical protein